jgi:hypothetical protein
LTTLARVDADVARGSSDPTLFSLAVAAATIPGQIAIVLVDPLGRRAMSDKTDVA